jgi:MFS family permease
VAGVRALQARPGAALVVVGFFAQTFVRGLLITLIVVASIELLGLGEAGIGLLSASIGAGGFAGALVALRLAGRPRLAPAFALALALWGLPIAIIGAWPVAVLAASALFVTGVSNAVLDVAGFTLLQRSVPHQSRLAVFGLLEGVAGLGGATGGLTAPLLLGGFGPRGALFVAGAILPILALVTWPGVAQTDREAVIPERQLARLRAIPLFAPLPLTALERLAGAAVPVEFAPGQVLMAEGEPGDHYIIIETGDVEVTDAGRYLRTVGPGEGIGEIALLRQVPRTATVTAIGRVTGYTLDAAAFLDAVAAPASSAAAAVVIGERLAHSTKARSIE